MLRRHFIQTAAAAGMVAAADVLRGQPPADKPRARIAITLDLEMSRHYPRRGMTEWDYRKGDLDDDTKQYAVHAARVAREHGGLIHFFCVGRVLEQPDVAWLKELAAAGHLIGNHTYDHVNVHAKTHDELQFRFQRSPWLIEGQSIAAVIRQNIAVTSQALRQRTGIEAIGFRTPGGFADGLSGREDLQRMLLELGFTWVSSKYPRHLAGAPMQEPTQEVYDSIVAAQAEAQPFVYPSGLIEIPMSPISDVGAFRTNYWKLDWFLKATELSVRWAIEHSAVFDFLGHPSCLVIEDPGLEIIKLICSLAADAKDRATIVGLDAIAPIK